ncbi:CRISPR-associated protein [Clostridium tepidiprofundi DSM 19306]|uniref:CRISPR-associated protein n=1 Tax=Clostridium tepidiprofundi DSM 19306 TaxID=1121338 RepID=A0A151B2D5_9CLOT|nr:CRISPR-associated protein Cas5 [Clostridium tepidiprofundi]KYH34079.1 CRISPR-associated protein [Clostridium tepidiprofundi DSM 19306]
MIKISKEKVLLLDIKQPFAHYREPKVMQNDYIPTLNLPPVTTVAGMISYLTDRKLKSKYKIGIVGKYKNKINEFVRGEYGKFFSDYQNLLTKQSKKINKEKGFKMFEVAQFYNYHKKSYGNRIMHFETLQEVELKIFLSTEDNELVKNSLETPSKYLSLGRKEDFIMPSQKGDSFVKEVEIDTVYIENKKEAIKNDLIFKNTYVPVNIKSDSSRYIMQQGVLYSLPKKYKDFNAEKQDRVIEYGHYVYLNDEGCYIPDIETNIFRKKDKNGNDENILFTWL